MKESTTPQSSRMPKSPRALLLAKLAAQMHLPVLSSGSQQAHQPIVSGFKRDRALQEFPGWPRKPTASAAVIADRVLFRASRRDLHAGRDGRRRVRQTGRRDDQRRQRPRRRVERDGHHLRPHNHRGHLSQHLSLARPTIRHVPLPAEVQAESLPAENATPTLVMLAEITTRRWVLVVSCKDAERCVGVNARDEALE